MIRDEEIKNASEAYASKMCSNCSAKPYCDEKDKKCVEHLVQTKTFAAGANWADQQSINVWHDASEMPERSSCEILYEIRSDNGFGVTHIPEGLTAGNWDNVLNVLGMTRWAYVSDLLPKGGE